MEFTNSSGTAGDPTRDIYTRLLDRLDRTAAVITMNIRMEVPAYAATPLAEHTIDVDRQIRNVVTGLLAGSIPSAAAIEHARGVGRRRASAGMTLPDVIEAYHIAYRDVWSEILDDAQRFPAPVAEALASEVSLLWLWFHRLCAAVADGHATETQQRRNSRIALERALLEQLLGTGTTVNETVAAELGYRSEAEFGICCIAGLAHADDALRISEAMQSATGPARCLYHDGLGIAIYQDCSAREICDVVHTAVGTARIGLGLPRMGIAGAATSLAEARLALARTTEEAVIVDFRTDWLLCVVNAQRSQLTELIEPVAAVASQHPRLAATVRAYASSGYSVSAAARRLHIHPNSARYRLDRWAELTGCDVGSFTGLTTSVIALELVRGLMETRTSR